ncbi:MAG: hypothetical protein K1W04_00520 [Oscillospiraceae bacterium]|jgi:hypothetical protein
MKKRILALVLALVMVFALCACSGGGKSAAVTVTVVHGDGSTKDFNIKTDKEMLGEALTDEKLIDGEDGPYGLFVKTVDGETADDAAQEWWCLTKGGGTVNTGIDSTPVEDGAAYELTLMTGWEET